MAPPIPQGTNQTQSIIDTTANITQTTPTVRYPENQYPATIFFANDGPGVWFSNGQGLTPAAPTQLSGVAYDTRANILAYTAAQLAALKGSFIVATDTPAAGEGPTVSMWFSNGTTLINMGVAIFDLQANITAVKYPPAKFQGCTIIPTDAAPSAVFEESPTVLISITVP